MAQLIKSYLRTVGSVLPLSGNKDGENINFARFNDEPTTPTRDVTELKNIQNGTVTSKDARGYQNGECPQENGAAYKSFEEQDYTEDVQEQDKITEWQAGWNVTNAIQVGDCRCPK